MSRVILVVEGQTEQAVVNQVMAPINDNPNMSPSRRIQQLVPEYRKGKSLNAHAWRILMTIGMKRLREKCKHFGEWVERLEKTAR